MLDGINAVAFDLDGTLYPNYSLNARLLPFLCRHLRLVLAFGKARDIIREEQEKSPWAVHPDFYEYQAQIVAALLNKTPEQVKNDIDNLIYRGWEAHFLRIQIFPHVREFLAELRKSGLKLGLLSDFPPEIKLNNLNLADCWDAVLCSETIGALKPAIRPFAELADALGCAPDQILYVGNSRSYDAEGALRAGMKTALFTRCCTYRDKNKAIFTFRNYRQLRDFVLQ